MTRARPPAARRPGPARASHPRQAAADCADEVLTSLYHDHYRSLVRLVTLLVADVATAEDISQDAFAGMRVRQRGMKDPSACLAYLRHALVREARAARRRPPAPDREDPGLSQLAVFALLRSLHDRQREALVLRYYADLSEAEAAAAMGVTRGALRRHTARGLTAARDHAPQLFRY